MYSWPMFEIDIERLQGVPVGHDYDPSNYVILMQNLELCKRFCLYDAETVLYRVHSSKCECYTKELPYYHKFPATWTTGMHGRDGFPLIKALRWTNWSITVFSAISTISIAFIISIRFKPASRLQPPSLRSNPLPVTPSSSPFRST
eukprot:UN04064